MLGYAEKKNIDQICSLGNFIMSGQWNAYVDNYNFEYHQKKAM